MSARTEQKIDILKRYYYQRDALLSKRNSNEYNKEQYKNLMNVYNESIKQKRSELSKEELFKLDRDRRNENSVTKGTKLKPYKQS